MTNKNNKIRGCLVGGAVGDALGYAVEFYRERQIFSRYGKDGITEYKLAQRTGKALYSSRAPGNTCLSALQQRVRDTKKTNSFIESKINNSKGCGGIMRAAPLGLIAGIDVIATDQLAAEAAAITHSHSLGYMPAAVLAHIVNRIVYPVSDMSLKEIVSEAKKTVSTIFENAPEIITLSKIIDLAVDLSENNESDLNNIHRLGEGWVGEETLGIALYCLLRYQDDFSKGIIAAVNHNGDSDSTGAVTGNILGAISGYNAIDNKWKDNLELIDVILKVSDDMSCL